MSAPSDAATLTADTYRQGIGELCAKDPDLAGVVAKWGNPPFWVHEPGFAGMVVAILAQQVSLESAEAAFNKLEKAIGSVYPEGFLALADDTLRAIGFSRQKAAYVRGIASAITTGSLDFASLDTAPNDAARKSLMALRGVGAWTADAYLLFSLRRQDAWPSGDLALIKAIQQLRAMAATPSPDAVDRIARRWKPWRAVAARILWHFYLSERGRSAAL